MTTHKRKKVVKYRGSKTHGGGSMKKRRGAGHRGGRGMAGTGKRGDVKKPSIWKNTKYFGKYGFSSKNIHREKTLNISYIEQNIESLVAKGKATEKGGVYSINLTTLRYTKLLGSGKPTKKYDLIINEASEIAIKRIESAGGKVTIREKPKKDSAAAKKKKSSDEDGSSELE